MRIIESAVIILLFLAVKVIATKVVNRKILKKNTIKTRGIFIKKVIHIINLVICLILLLTIWGVKHSDLAIFVGSILTVIGVAMFAQWSLLSNITSSILIFFYHSIKIGDKISIMEAKDYEIQGIIMDVGLIFVKIKTFTTNEEISLPNNIFIQKTVRKLNLEDSSAKKSDEQIED